jgi:hypothetical protein
MLAAIDWSARKHRSPQMKLCADFCAVGSDNPMGPAEGENSLLAKRRR